MLAPQELTTLRHLIINGSITRVEAEAVHKIRHIPTRIFTLKKRGCAIESQHKSDATGQRYVRYQLHSVPAYLVVEEGMEKLTELKLSNDPLTNRMVRV